MQLTLFRKGSDATLAVIQELPEFVVAIVFAPALFPEPVVTATQVDAFTQLIEVRKPSSRLLKNGAGRYSPSFPSFLSEAV